MNRINIPLLYRNCLATMGLLSVCGFFFACEKDPEPLTTNSVITGRAYINTPYDDEGIIVVASGPWGQSSGITDDNGYFVIAGLGNGTYYLDYSKEGYGTIRQHNIQVFGNDTVRANIVGLYKKPEVLKVPNFKKAYTGIRPGPYSQKTYICIDTDIMHQSVNLYGFQLVLCMSSKEDVSWGSYKICHFLWEGQFNGVFYTIYIDPEKLHSIYSTFHPFNTGDKVYVRGYPCNKAESGGYIDTYLGIIQYSTLDKTSQTNIISFVMP